MSLREARSSIAIAKGALDDAQSLDTEDFPGLVINSSYSAMNNAAMGVLQAYEDWAPIRKNEVVKEFADFAIAKKNARLLLLAKDLNYVFDRQVYEEYGEFGEADVDEANEIVAMAEEFINVCEGLVEQVR